MTDFRNLALTSPLPDDPNQSVGRTVSIWDNIAGQAVSVWQFRSTVTYKPSSDPRTWDWSPAFQAAVDRSLFVYVPPGKYLTQSPIVSVSSGQRIFGAGSVTTVIEPQMTDGSAAFRFSGVSGDSGRKNGGGLGRMTVNGGDRNVVLLNAEFWSKFEAPDLDLRNSSTSALVMTQVWDSALDVWVRQSGNLASTTPAALLKNDATDGCNRVQFTPASLFEGNHWTPLKIDSSFGSRACRMVEIIGAKFHGKGGVPRLSQPACRFIEADCEFFSATAGAYFYLCNNDFIQVMKPGFVVQGCKFFNSTGAEVRVASAAVSDIDPVITSCIGPNLRQQSALPILETASTSIKVFDT